MASTFMPPIPFNRKFLPHRRNRISGGALGNRGAPLSGVTEVRTYIQVSHLYLRAPSGGPARRIRMRQSGANRSGSSKGCGPCAAKRLSRGGRRGPDVSRIWETSERRRCNDSAPRQARKMKTAAQHSDNENRHGGNKTRHLERRTPPYPRKPQNKLPPPRSSWPRSGTGCSGWKTDKSTSVTKHENSEPIG